MTKETNEFPEWEKATDEREVTGKEIVKKFSLT